MNIRTMAILDSVHRIYFDERKHLMEDARSWINKHKPLWEYNKLAIGAVGIFLQVTVAAAMIGILGMADGSLWIAGIGIFFAFMANSAVFGQAPITWIIAILLMSMLVNASIAIYYAIQLF
jgi:hypothetical protein